MAYKEISYKESESTNLNYQRKDMTYVEIKSRGQPSVIENIVLDDAEKIKEIINYINSLEIVEVERINIEVDWTLEKHGWISVYLGKYSDHTPGDSIQFMEDYMRASYNGRDKEGKSYYVKNSGYDNKTRNSNAYQFLYDLINRQ